MSRSKIGRSDTAAPAKRPVAMPIPRPLRMDVNVATKCGQISPEATNS